MSRIFLRVSTQVLIWGVFFLIGCGNQADSSTNSRVISSLSSPDVPVVLALKVVAFSDERWVPTIKEEQAKKLALELDTIFSTCKISFKVENYSVVNPTDYGLPYHLSSVDKMHEVRKPFDDPRYLVVINTGSWDHKKMGAPNAWTAMPGELPAGAVLEASVSTFAGIVAHEIGHYLSLNHMEKHSNLMNPIIYEDSTQLTSRQCSDIRATALKVRSLAVRQYDGGRPTVNLSAAYSG